MLTLLNEVKNDNNVELNNLKNKIKSILINESYNISEKTRNKNLLILTKHSSVNEILIWAYNLCLKGDNLGTINLNPVINKKY